MTPIDTSKCYVYLGIETARLIFCSKRLSQFWHDVFPGQPLKSHCLEQYPLLMGIMRRSAGEERWSFTSEYEWKPLVRCDKLTRTEEPVTRATLLRELIAFREECHAHEQTLVKSLLVFVLSFQPI